MHAALQIAPVLAAEKSKVPFYIAGGVLVLWALFISIAVGMRKPDFPANAGQQRAVMAISIVLVLAAVSMAVVTSGGETKSASAATTTETTSTETSAATSSSTPTATTGAPAPSPAGSATTQLSLAANPEGQLKYDKSSLTAKAGTVTITMANMSPVEHNVTIEQGGKVLGATPTFDGGTRKLTLSLKPGVYTFFCSVPGHRQAGMEGKLTVTS